MIKQMKVVSKQENVNLIAKVGTEKPGDDREGNDDQYDSSEFDDDSTIESAIAKSISDEEVYTAMQKEGEHECLCKRHDSIPHPKEACFEHHNHYAHQHDETPNTTFTADTSMHNDQQTIRLPSVLHTQQAKESETKSHLEKKVAVKNNSTEFSLKRSPYAVSQPKIKRSIGQKKKKIQNSSIYMKHGKFYF